MESSFNKWGKQIEYSITPETMSLVVKENQDTWIYITKRDFSDKVLSSTISSAGVRPEFIKKREMIRLMNHFGIKKDIIDELQTEAVLDIEINV